MNSEFFRFPHTPHLAWLGQGAPRDDKVLSSFEVDALLATEVVVEEKLDGANLGFSLAPDLVLRMQNRGNYLAEPYSGQFSRLPAWLGQKGDALRSVLAPNIILFGEWCAARHSLDYLALPDWFLLFDVYDRSVGRFWSSSRRDALADDAGLATVPQMARGKFSVSALKRLVTSTSSRYRQGPPEGLVVRQDSAQWCEARAKLVRDDFTQCMDTHWRKRIIEWNRVDSSLNRRF
nr:RNA ligase family protein [uncultured Roseateles sp.]